MIVLILSLVGTYMAAYLFQRFPLGTLESLAIEQLDGEGLKWARGETARGRSMLSVVGASAPKFVECYLHFSACCSTTVLPQR